MTENEAEDSHGAGGKTNRRKAKRRPNKKDTAGTNNLEVNNIEGESLR